jgi:hypothetical protein
MLHNKLPPQVLRVRADHIHLVMNIGKTHGEPAGGRMARHKGSRDIIDLCAVSCERL